MVLGNRVVLIRQGNTYSTYDKMFDLMGFKDKEFNRAFEVGTEATIFSMCPHLEDPKRGLLYGIRADNGKECLIAADGLKLSKTFYKTPKGLIYKYKPMIYSGYKYYSEEQVIMYGKELLELNIQ